MPFKIKKKGEKKTSFRTIELMESEKKKHMAETLVFLKKLVKENKPQLAVETVKTAV